jgi:hypothetical protein
MLKTINNNNGKEFSKLYQIGSVQRRLLPFEHFFEILTFVSADSFIHTLNILVLSC